MRRKYRECLRTDGNCTRCDMVVDGRDCHGRLITKLEWARLAAGMGQKELSEKSGVQVKLIQNVELGKGEAGNMTTRNIIAIAKTLGVSPESLI